MYVIIGYHVNSLIANCSAQLMLAAVTCLTDRGGGLLSVLIFFFFGLAAPALNI